jgi:hypothetical protein
VSFNLPPQFRPQLVPIRRITKRGTRKPAANGHVQVVSLGLRVESVTGKDVTELFEKIRDNGGGGWLPKLASTGQGRRRRETATAEKENPG